MNKDIKRFYIIRAFKFLFGAAALILAIYGGGTNTPAEHSKVCLLIVIACAIGFFVTFVLSDRVTRRLSK